MASWAPRERVSRNLQFRLETFNTLNHTDWHGVNVSVSLHGRLARTEKPTPAAAATNMPTTIIPGLLANFFILIPSIS
jgi:hypothetical protein